jgi:hypothetical protein
VTYSAFFNLAAHDDSLRAAKPERRSAFAVDVRLAAKGHGLVVV